MQVVDLTDEHYQFVTLCTHEYQPSDEGDRVIAVRRSWLERMMARGLKIKVAVDGGDPVGFIHCLPLELGIQGMSGTDLMAIPCLTLGYRSVYRRKTGSGYGRALIEAAESEARSCSKGIAVVAHDNDFWFMPAAFFRRLGYREVARRADTVVMLKSFQPVEPPVMHHPSYRPRPIPGKVTVDVFWHPMCGTSIVEMLRLREVSAEFGDGVVLNEYDCGDKDTLERYQIGRAIFIDGRRVDWGHEAPRDGLRQEIGRAAEAAATQDPDSRGGA